MQLLTKLLYPVNVLINSRERSSLVETSHQISPKNRHEDQSMAQHHGATSQWSQNPLDSNSFSVATGYCAFRRRQLCETYELGSRKRGTAIDARAQEQHRRKSRASHRAHRPIESDACSFS